MWCVTGGDGNGVDNVVDFFGGGFGNSGEFGNCLGNGAEAEVEFGDCFFDGGEAVEEFNHGWHGWHGWGPDGEFDRGSDVERGAGGMDARRI